MHPRSHVPVASTGLSLIGPEETPTGPLPFAPVRTHPQTPSPSNPMTDSDSLSPASKGDRSRNRLPLCVGLPTAPCRNRKSCAAAWQQLSCHSSAFKTKVKLGVLQLLCVEPI